MTVEIGRREIFRRTGQLLVGGAVTVFVGETALGTAGQMGKIQAKEICRQALEENPLHPVPDCETTGNSALIIKPSPWRTRIEGLAILSGAVLWIRNRRP